MFVIVEIGEKQFLVKEGDILTVDGTFEGKTYQSTSILFSKSGDTIKIGQPLVEKASVNFDILEAGKREKDIVFKFKPKTGYKLTRGHRQPSTLLKVKKINYGE